MRKNSYEIDMCNGPLFGKILRFSIPLMLTSILQLLFNAADMVVAGQFAGSIALGAVGATSALINLLINIFIGLSVGANVEIAHFYGAKQEKDLSETMHTAIALSVLGGVILSVAGFLLANPLLSLMGTPTEILPHSVIYMKIYFIGMPVTLLYNFGSAILRAVGDTRHPLYYLSFAGAVNVILNLFFVIVCKMGVAGVALATILSQTISAVLIIRCLKQADGLCRFEWRKCRLHADKVKRILWIGLPAGFQGAIFSISNVLIQSSVNSFGAVAVAGNTAAANLEGFVYNAMNAFHQAAVSFTSQNMGAKKLERVKKIQLICQGCVTATGLIMGYAGLLFGKQLLSVYSSQQDVIAFGMRRLIIVFSTYFLCGNMDVLVGSLRGMGYSILPMVVSLMGACGFRIFWIFTVFVQYRTPEVLYSSYPVSWAITASCHLICFLLINRKLHARTE